MAIPFYGASDVDTLLREFGVPVVRGSESTTGIVDEVDIEMMAGDGATFVGHQTSILVRTGSLEDPAAQDIIVVNGVRYRVATVSQVDDGGLTRLLCAQA